MGDLSPCVAHTSCFLSRGIDSFCFQRYLYNKHLEDRDAISFQEEEINMFAVGVPKANVSLWNKGRADLFATLPMIKVSYIRGSSAVMQTPCGAACNGPHCCIALGDLKSKGTNENVSPRLHAVPWVIHSFLSCPLASGLLPAYKKLWEVSLLAWR